MRKKNLLKEKLKNGETVIGTWAVTPSSSVANIIAASNFDFIIIDMEHGPVSFETAEDMVRAAESESSTPLLRVPSNNPEIILRGLEVGSHGIVVPQIENAEGAQKAVKAIKYYPLGNRGFSPFTRSAGYIAKGADLIAERENKETFVGLLVEGKTGLDNLDSIVNLANIDMIYLGVYDLSQSLGIPGQVDNPKIKDLLKSCTEKIRAKGIAVGTLAKTIEDIKEFQNLGINFIAYKADCAILSDACLAVINNIKK
jgi:4-hydroxy-2-oxoheptanedioate aldolase